MGCLNAANPKKIGRGDPLLANSWKKGEGYILFILI
jgi:hypothetical protein